MNKKELQELPHAEQMSSEQIAAEREATLGNLGKTASQLEMLPNGTVVTAQEHQESIARGEDQTVNGAYETGRR